MQTYHYLTTVKLKSKEMPNKNMINVHICIHIHIWFKCCVFLINKTTILCSVTSITLGLRSITSIRLNKLCSTSISSPILLASAGSAVRIMLLRIFRSWSIVDGSSNFPLRSCAKKEVFNLLYNSFNNVWVSLLPITTHSFWLEATTTIAQYLQQSPWW